MSNLPFNKIPRSRPRPSRPHLSEHSQSHSQSHSHSLPRIHAVNETTGQETCHGADVVVLVPKGNRCLFWFTVRETQNVCYVIEVTHVSGVSSSYGKQYIVKTCFHTSMSYGDGTILRGTSVRHKGATICSIDDVYYHKGECVQSQSLIGRMRVIHDIFQYDLQQIRYFANQVVFAPCIMLPGNTSVSDIQNRVDALPYPVKYIQFRYAQRNTSNIVNVDVDHLVVTGPVPPPPPPPLPPPLPPMHQGNNVMIQITPCDNGSNSRHLPRNPQTDLSRRPAHMNANARVADAVFKIRADLQNDVYKLYTYGPGGADVYHGIAGIQSYNDSVRMNKLFRNIKENRNLDALEESDDEEDFENVAIDKYVNLEASYRMVCRYVARINRWVPLNVAARGQRMATQTQVFYLGRKE